MCDPVSALDFEYSIPRPKGGMSLRQIVEADVAKNYAGEKITAEGAYKTLQAMVQNGATLYRAGNTVFVTEKLSPTTVEFHAINGSSIPQLVANLVKYISHLRKNKVTTATAYFSNPKNIDVLTQANLDFETTKINEGPTRTFQAKVRV